MSDFIQYFCQYFLENQIIIDDLCCFVYGIDVSFYCLIFEVIIVIEMENDLKIVLIVVR